MSVRTLAFLVVLSCVLSTFGCAATRYAPAAETVGSANAVGAEYASGQRVERMLIREARLTVAVRDVADGCARAIKIAEAAEGFVERTSRYREDNASLALRVPADRLDATLEQLAALGKESRRSLSSRDVTADVVDLREVLRSKEALRERLRTLLGRAEAVTEILEIEKELARLQGEIDSMRGRLALLEGQVRLASIDLTLERRSLPGPVTLAYRGIAWCVGKLFVIR